MILENIILALDFMKVLNILFGTFRNVDYISNALR